MKKIISVIIIMCIPILLSSCAYGDYHTTDPDKYNPKDGYLAVDYFPESIDEYTVNSYSYNTYRYFDTCTEIFLDITATEKQFNNIIGIAEKSAEVNAIKPAFYDKDYTEIVIMDDYEKSDDSDAVMHADIKKIVYNTKTRNIVFEYFYAFDSNVYPVDEITFFQRFNIKEKDYFAHSERYYIDEESSAENKPQKTM